MQVRLWSCKHSYWIIAVGDAGCSTARVPPHLMAASKPLISVVFPVCWGSVQSLGFPEHTEDNRRGVSYVGSKVFWVNNNDNLYCIYVIFLHKIFFSIFFLFSFFVCLVIAVDLLICLSNYTCIYNCLTLALFFRPQTALRHQCNCTLPLGQMQVKGHPVLR